MTGEITPGRPTARRHTKNDKGQAIRLVFELRKELGTTQDTVIGVADQSGYGTESVRWRVADAEIEAGDASGMSAAEPAKMKKLEQENRELRRHSPCRSRPAQRPTMRQSIA
jgi:transposase